MSAVPARGVEARSDRPKPHESPGTPGDGELVRRFVATADPGAFEGLVRRHGPMVFGVCRRMLRDPHDADDAFQATFLVLLRKAGSVRPPQRVGHWLYGVACRTAMKVNSMNLRRRRKEQEAPPREQSHQGGDRSELRSMLDAELARMPKRYRAPIVMCELDGMSRRDAAQALRLPEGTLSSRLARARDLLRTRLMRRGLALSAGALVAGLTTESASASATVPATLLASVAKGSIGASGVAGAVPQHVALLAKGVIKAMWISKLKVVAATTVLIGTLGSGAAVVTHHVVAKQKEIAAARAFDKGGVPAPESVSTTVIALDPTAGTLTATIESGKGVLPSTLKLTKDVPVELAAMAKGAPTTPATLAEIVPGLFVSLQLSTDRITVTRITILGQHLTGTIKSIDAAAKAITVVSKTKTGEVEKNLPLHPDARIRYSGEGKNKLAPSPPATLADLAAGAPVSIDISPDGKSITSITIDGKSAHGMVSSVDQAARSISISTKSEDGPIELTFTISPEAVIFIGEGKPAQPGTLADVSKGMSVDLRTSPRDAKTVISIHASMPVIKDKGEK